MSLTYPTFAQPGNPQNGYPMMYFNPQQPFHPQGPQVYDPAAAQLAMPSFVPEQQPVFYTFDGHGNYVVLAPQQYAPVVPAGPNYEYHHPMRTTYSDGNADSAQPHDAYNLNTSGVSRKSFGSADKFRAISNPYKTMMCNMFSTTGSCIYGEGCQYAHGSKELRPIIPHPKYKTTLCNKFNSPGGCQYGNKCHFRHPDDGQPDGTPATPKTPQRKPSHGSGKKKNGRKSGKQNTATPKEKPESAAVKNTAAENKDGKKDSLITFAMYRCFESYIGKNRNAKPDALKRTNSSSTIGTFTLQRYVSMKKALEYMHESKKKPQPDTAVMKQQEKKCSSSMDQQQEAPAAVDGETTISS